MEGLDLFSKLPEGCISHIISFTSPRDACRSSAVCSIFQSASESDSVWERFLPPDYPDVLAGSVSPPGRISSKKELFFRLCNPVLIDDNKMSFSINKMSCKKCYMLSARKLGIIWGDDPRYWKWTSHPKSRFRGVAELLHVCCLHISGKIDAHILSPKTTYKVFLVTKFLKDAYLPRHAETSVKLGSHESNKIVFLRVAVPDGVDGQVPQARSDGWMEIEMGEFFNDEGEEGDVEMIFKQTTDLRLKAGIFIEGIEIRPVS